jgi:hypothetical protein
VSHERFIQGGNFDRDGFREAIKEEIKDWDGIGRETVIGGAAPVPSPETDKTETNEAAEDDAAVDKMLIMAEPERATQH